ncbi:SIP5 [Candida oxycetoniae]|uniref:SIP5 n=1 Tax=Candida oxycetoniae TaxID=497107 RepID=A0AAI9X0A0_9ASCO|nr:SIP5 [Candida oxycetoniae]KAI3407043.2 SIP5 [Candida oxycetoniae]
MGNVPAKESRSRSNSAVSDFHSGGSANTYNTSASTTSSGNRGGRYLRNTANSGFIGAVAGGGGSNSGGHHHHYHQRTVSSDLRKQKRQEEKDQKQLHHYSHLIVKHDENVDGGYLAPYGTYKSNLDFDVDIVRSLIINRELSPFFTPLQDFDDSWTDQELLILLSQLTLHALEEPTELNEDFEEDDVDRHKIHKSNNYFKRQEEKAKLKSLISKMKEAQKDEENKFLEIKKNHGKQCFSKDLMLKLYRSPCECPICFLYYPPFLNVSRCCLQPICSECFVQIKRLDPHPPHDDPSNQQAGEQPHSLISEPASCPYCAMPNFGVTYDPPPDIRTGINGIPPSEYKTVSLILEEEGRGSSSSSNANNNNLTDGDEESMGSPSPGRTSISSPPPANSMMTKVLKRKKGVRRGSIAADSPGVIAVDMIRPDWEINLNSARNKLARKAATASAIHASNLIIEGNSSNNDSSRVRSNSGIGYAAVEQRMIEEAMRLSLIDEEERRKKADK